METPSGMIIDATEAIGVFAANEAHDRNPNLTCIGVSLPNPLNDESEEEPPLTAEALSQQRRRVVSDPDAYARLHPPRPRARVYV